MCHECTIASLGPSDEQNRLWEEIKRLREKLHDKQRELEEYKKRHPKTVGVKHGKAFVIPTPLEPRTPTGRTSGGQIGHPGHWRPTPTRIDAHVPVPVETCPDCHGHNLSSVQETRKRIIEEVMQPKARAIQYEIDRRYCRDCKALVEAPIPDALPGARIGLRSMLMVAWLRIACRQPEATVATVMAECLGLTISEGEVQGILYQLAEALRPIYDDVLRDLRNANVKHIDETSWKTNGVNNYAWAFVTKTEALYLLGRNRTHKVPLEVLGPDAKGTIVTDGFSAYGTLTNATNLDRARCWSHVLGDAKELAQFHGEEGQALLDGLKPIYERAKNHKGKATAYQVERLRNDIKAVLDKPFQSHTCKSFARNHLRNIEDLLRFAYDPEVEGTNNRAERAIRPLAVTRKISGGSRSQRAADVRAILTTIIQTFALRGKPFLKTSLPPRPASAG